MHKIEGHFCNRVLTSSGTESRICFIRGGESNRDWFFLKLKLDDFTSGFRTRYADMAGCWEEVVAVGGGVRTGSGTGVELDKKTRRTEPLKAKYWRAGPLLNKRTIFG